jgi:putative ABC transport system substrate-binding protein
VDKVQEALEAKGISCQMFRFADTSDMTAVTAEAANYADVIYVPTDNTVANYANVIYSICQPAGVPIIAGEAGICSGCGVATMSIDYYDLGYETGKMAVEILRDGADITQMAIRYAPNVTYYYNEAICEEMGVTPVEGYTKLVTEE